MAKRRNSPPQYLTTNQAGTYVFQVRIPRHICQNNPHIKPTLWRSLGTKDHAEALRLSKRMWLMFDELSSKFNDSKVFGKAMELLRDYNINSKDGWLKAEQFLMDLDIEDDRLLERVLKYESEIQQSQNNSVSSISVEDIKKLISDAALQKMNNEPDFSKDNRLLSDMIDEFMNERINDGLAKGSRKPYRSKLKQFNAIIQAFNNNKPVRLSDLDKNKMRHYSEIMGMFPNNYKIQPAFKDKSLEEVVTYVMSHKNREELEAKGIKLLDDKNEPFRLVRSLLTYIENKKYPLRAELYGLYT